MTRQAHEGVRRQVRPAAIFLAAVVGCMQAGCMSAERAAEIETAAAERSPLTHKPAPDFALPNQDGETVTLQA
ncbi:MAG TPA: hypothetical protein VMZ31_12275, partial [Phycisphaerae bacterium]|nr:hypothetical protein [Phycisphaerae bacterium]